MISIVVKLDQMRLIAGGTQNFSLSLPVAKSDSCLNQFPTMIGFAMGEIIEKHPVFPGRK